VPYSMSDYKGMQQYNTLNQLDISQLKLRAQTLRKLCEDLDPYSPLTLDEIKLLESLGVYDYNDPFQLTNELIMRMEDTLEEILKRETESTAPKLH
jgi:hypothetical protein